MRQQMKTFDTYTHINELKKAGFKEEQAAVIIKSLVDIRETDISTLATKDQVNVLRNEIDGLKKDTKSQIDSLRNDTKSQIDSLRNKTKALILETHASTLKWMVGTMIAFSGIILAGLKLL